MFSFRKSVSIFIFLCFFLSVRSQPISLSAGKMKGIRKNGKEIQRLEGNVMFEQNGNTVTCDNADYDTEAEELTGTGNVVIVSSEGVRITGSSLVYNNLQKMAKVEGGVKLTDKDMTLTTPWIHYNTDSKIGWYGAGGRIVDKDIVLTSGTGSYNPNIKMLYFRNNVVLTHPEYTVKSDTLQHNTATSTSYFFSYTEITSDENTILCNYGSYNSRTGKSYFTRNAAILSKENIIRADTLEYDRNSGIGTAKGNLWVKDTLKRITIFGNKGYYNRKNKYTRVTGNPLARQYEKNGDSLMVRADTFIYSDDSLAGKRTLICYPDVKMWRVDFSGTADSMAYVVEDSMFRLFGTPVLWNETTRLNSDSMRILLKNSKIAKMEMRRNSFIAMKEDEAHFSQISGENMDNLFSDDNKLKLVNVRGNGRSVYYAKEKDSSITTANVVECADMKINLDSGRVKDVRFYASPKGNIYPIDQLPSERSVLPGFLWDEMNRPEAEQFTPPFKIPELPKNRKEIEQVRKNAGKKTKSKT